MQAPQSKAMSRAGNIAARRFTWRDITQADGQNRIYTSDLFRVILVRRDRLDS
jgi:hypothetical protein